jgi:small subunit ribosomal protein S20
MANSKLKKKIGVGRHLSSIKRARQTKKRRMRNKGAVSRMKTEVKLVRLEPTLENLKKAVPRIAKSAKKGVIHKKKASRLISRLAKAVNKAK